MLHEAGPVRVDEQVVGPLGDPAQEARGLSRAGLGEPTGGQEHQRPATLAEGVPSEEVPRVEVLRVTREQDLRVLDARADEVDAVRDRIRPGAVDLLEQGPVPAPEVEDATPCLRPAFREDIEGEVHDGPVGPVQAASRLEEVVLVVPGGVSRHQGEGAVPRGASRPPRAKEESVRGRSRVRPCAQRPHSSKG